LLSSGICACNSTVFTRLVLQTVEEMISKEQELQVKLKKVLVAMETKRTDFDNIRQDVKKQWSSMTSHFLLPQEWNA
jgi:hypothetical protein